MDGVVRDVKRQEQKLTEITTREYNESNHNIRSSTNIEPTPG